MLLTCETKTLLDCLLYQNNELEQEKNDKRSFFNDHRLSILNELKKLVSCDEGQKRWLVALMVRMWMDNSRSHKPWLIPRQSCAQMTAIDMSVLVQVCCKLELQAELCEVIDVLFCNIDY